MGHLRLGRLPKTHRWLEVVRLLEEQPGDTAVVAHATARAAEQRLRELASDPSLTYCFWLLTRLTWAARRDDFISELTRLGLRLDQTESTLAFIARVSDLSRSELNEHPESGPFAELASLALRRALTETVGQHGPGLFGSSVDDLRHALRVYSTQAQFGILAKRFFGDFIARTLRFFLDRELLNHVGPARALSNLEESEEFRRAIDTHTRQSARIMQDFAGGWYSKHNWESKGQISREEANDFVAVALRKLRTELKREAQVR